MKIRDLIKWVVRFIKSALKKKTMMHVPDDVIVQIFAKLPAKSLLRFRWLSKYWFKVITDPYFVKMHLNSVHATNNPLVLIYSSIDRQTKILEILSLNSISNLNRVHQESEHIKSPLPFTPTSLGTITRILGSCNGLLCVGCFTTARFEKICIWNPCTKEYKMLWQDELVSIRETGLITYGFGYDCSIDDYKVIRNVCPYDDNGTGYIGETLVYTLGTSSSKKLRNSRFFLRWGINSAGLFINGDLYWKGKLTRSGPFNTIVAFDIAKEEYREIVYKPYINYDKSNYMNLGKLKGCLYVFNITANWMSLEVWVMKHNVDNMKKEYSWDMLYTISAPPGNQFMWYLKPLGFRKNGEIVMVMSDDLIFYDPKNNRIRFIPKVRVSMMVDTNYVESLVPVKGGSKFV